MTAICATCAHWVSDHEKIDMDDRRGECTLVVEQDVVEKRGPEEFPMSINGGRDYYATRLLTDRDHGCLAHRPSRRGGKMQHTIRTD